MADFGPHKNTVARRKAKMAKRVESHTHAYRRCQTQARRQHMERNATRAWGYHTRFFSYHANTMSLRKHTRRYVGYSSTPWTRTYGTAIHPNTVTYNNLPPPYEKTHVETWDIPCHGRERMAQPYILMRSHIIIYLRPRPRVCRAGKRGGGMVPSRAASTISGGTKARSRHSAIRRLPRRGTP